MSDLSNIEEKMKKSVSVFGENLSEVRAGRANPAILNKISVEYYGVSTPINQVAAVSVPEARMIVIQPWDASCLKDIEKAILASDIGLNPNNDGKVIRLNFPELTEETRKNYVKQVKDMAEETRIALRNIRQDANNNIKKQEFAEDEEKGYLDGDIPILKITNIENTNKPKDEFVYPPDDTYIPTSVLY